MRIPLRAWAIALLVSLAYGSFVIACPEWTRDLGLDVWNSVRDGSEMAAQQRESRRLQMASERVRKRLEMKEMIVYQLIDDRMDLNEATDQFMTLNELEPELASFVRVHFPGANDREKTMAQVMSFASTIPAHNSSQCEEITKRLKRQFQALTGRDYVKTSS
jgi:hypothetical protein